MPVRDCTVNDVETLVIKAAREESVMHSNSAVQEAIAYIMTQKFVTGNPLYRQEQKLQRQSIRLSRQPMSNWILKTAEQYLEPVFEQLHNKREVFHTDETTL